MTTVSREEMLKLADGIEYAIKTTGQATLFEGGAKIVLAALRCAQAENASLNEATTRVCEAVGYHLCTIQCSGNNPNVKECRCEDAARAALRSPPMNEAMIEAAARELWNDRDARMGGSWESRSPDEICVIQTKATAKAMLTAALVSREERRVPANDCRDPSSCDRHNECMYLGCSAFSNARAIESCPSRVKRRIKL